MRARSDDDTEFRARFENVREGVLASYLVKFPKGSGLRKQSASLCHADQDAAEAWIQDQAARRGITRILRP
jgi:hypothetical protein